MKRLTPPHASRVDDQTAELERLNRDLESLAYIIAHDLRTPLQTISGVAHAIGDDLVHELPEDIRASLARITHCAERLARLVDDILLFARVSRRQLQKEDVNVLLLVYCALAELEPERAGRSIEIITGECPPCQADPTLLGHLYVNLLANALKFTRTREFARVETGSYERDGRTVYFVRDNGVGFNMDDAGKLFGIGQRLHRGEEFEGTGIGLAIARSIVDRHGGTIWAEAEPDRGATFCFTL